MTSATEPATLLLALLGTEPSPEAEPDPLKAAVYVTERLARHTSEDAVGHAVQQVAVAVAATVARVVGSGELSFGLARSLPPLLREMDVAIACNRPVCAAAVRLEAALDAVGDALTAREARATLGTLCALMQAQHDTLHIQRIERTPAAAGPRHMSASNCSRDTALALLDALDQQATARPAEAALLETLRGMTCLALALSAHLGGPEASPVVAVAIGAVVYQLAEMAELGAGRGMVEAISDLTLRLASLVHALEEATGGVHGCKGALLAVCHDLRDLTGLAHAAAVAAG